MLVAYLSTALEPTFLPSISVVGLTTSSLNFLWCGSLLRDSTLSLLALRPCMMAALGDSLQGGSQRAHQDVSMWAEKEP